MLDSILAHRSKVLGLAWAAFIVSLFSPGTPVTMLFSSGPPGPVRPAEHAPVWSLLAWAAISVAARFLCPYVVLLFAAVIFLATPLLIVRATASRSGAAVRRLICCGLLSVWLVPLICSVFLKPTEASFWGCRELLWGYYLFASAHTLAFIVCVLPPFVGRTASAKVGFPVVSD